MKQYEGYFCLDTFLLTVRHIDDRLTVGAPGVPEGYEMILEPTDTPHTFTILRGPMAGVTAVFQHNADGQLTSVKVGDEYDLPYPKHEFLRYLAAQEMFIFHGSAKADIDEFQTRRTSMELKDKSGRGNVQGIYGTHDGRWWPVQRMGQRSAGQAAGAHHRHAGGFSLFTSGGWPR